MKTIIVPLDFSDMSFMGLNLSLMLAGKIGADIKMIYVTDRKDGANSEFVDSEYHRATSKFEDIINKQSEKSNLKLKYEIKEGIIFKEITKLADEHEDALIVLSTHGKSGFEELFIGGNAYKIISHSKNPVITIRKNINFSNINKIILPLDITFQTREKVSYTAKMAKLFNSEIHLISVRNSNFDGIEEKLHQYVEQVASYIRKQNVPCEIKHLHGDNLTDITLEYSRSVNADLISIMTEQEKSVYNLLLGSYAHQMINKAMIPVLSFPNYQLRIVTEDIWDLGAFNP